MWICVDCVRREAELEKAAQAQAEREYRQRVRVLFGSVLYFFDLFCLVQNHQNNNWLQKFQNKIPHNRIIKISIIININDYKRNRTRYNYANNVKNTGNSRSMSYKTFV